jgi:hypothetical protein
MSLTDLPPELLEQVVIRAIPEGFESLALCCKPIFGIRTPFIARHNQFCQQYTNFVYRGSCLRDEHGAWTSFDLIAQIAPEPIIARYIRRADFERDSF